MEAIKSQCKNDQKPDDRCNCFSIGIRAISKVSFRVGNTDKTNNGNYLYMGHGWGKEKKMREEFRATKFTDF